MKSAPLILENQRYLHSFKEEKIPRVDLLTWLEAIPLFPKMYWKAKGSEVEIAALGKVLQLSSAPLFDPANSSKARFFGGKAFPSSTSKTTLWNSFPTSIFFLPAFEIIQTKEETLLITHSIDSPCDRKLPAFSQQEKRLQQSTHRTDLPTYPDWEKVVENFLEEKKRQGLNKVVLARCTTFETEAPLSPFSLLAEVKKSGQNVTFFALQFSEKEAFIGASPEMLYTRKEEHLFSEAIAGTRPRGESDEEDLALENELLSSEKEIREFDYVKSYIKKKFDPLCLSLHMEETRVIKTSSVQHLHCPFYGKLKAATSDELLLNRLHPTPAVGGAPKEVALSYLQNVESFERGWYASALGFVSQNEASFAVGIRSALVEGCKVHLFAGVGIVEGSSPATEWDELEHKIALFKRILL